MGFHCGNTCSKKLAFKGSMKYQLIMNALAWRRRSSRTSRRGTLEGDIAPGDITFFRLQSTADSQLRAYVAAGRGAARSVPLLRRHRRVRHSRKWAASTAMCSSRRTIPHHGAVAFGHYGKALFEVFKYLGVENIGYNQPKSLPYPSENPFNK